MDMSKVFRSEKKGRLAIMHLANIMSVPTSLVAVINLKVPDAIWQGGHNTPLSASKILAIVRQHGGGDSENLERILRLLTAYDIFEEHISSSGERKYSLTEVGKTLAADEEGLSYAPYMLQHHQDAMMRAWPLVKEAVEDPTVEPFKKANGESAMAYNLKLLNQTTLYHEAFTGTTVHFMREMLELYDGFKGVETVVDIGGNCGVTLSMIMDKYPHISKGINFDLPEMIATAKQFPGITHVAGDALEYVPPGDAIFIKWLSMADESWKKIMQNCYDALPRDGKLIVCEPVLPELTDESERTRALLAGDVFVMTMYGAKHRTELQFKQLGISAGFSRFRAFYIDCYMGVLEFQK